MTTIVRRTFTFTVLALVAAMLGCGGGSSSWSLPADDGAWRVEMRIDTSGCGPEIIYQYDADLDDSGGLVTLRFLLPTFYDCPIGHWDLHGAHVSQWVVQMNDIVNGYVCQFDDRWDIEQFTITNFVLNYPGADDSFTATGDWSGLFGTTPCTGNIVIFGWRN